MAGLLLLAPDIRSTAMKEKEIRLNLLASRATMTSASARTRGSVAVTRATVRSAEIAEVSFMVAIDCFWRSALVLGGDDEG